MQHGGRCQNGPRLKIEMMVQPELVEELQSERLHLLGMFQIAAHSARKCLRARNHHLPAVALLFAGLRRFHLRARQFIQQAFAHAQLAE